ncbi:MAG: ribosome maturation factor RimM [Candidatus Omnitrophota bacterium]
MVIRRRKAKLRDDRIYLGKITKPHALKGELKFQPFGCDPRLIEHLKRVHLESPDLVLEVDYVRGSLKSPIVKFKTVDGRDASEKLIGSLLWLDEAELPELQYPGEYYEADFLYARVVTESGEDLGRIEEVLETGECDVLVVRGSNGEERLLPAILDVIKEVRKQEQTIVVTLQEEMD